MWFYRFDVYYRPFLDRGLPKAYRQFIVDTRGEGARVSGVPQSWKTHFETFRWEERAEAFHDAERVKLRKKEEEAREESRVRRIALLNATMNRAFGALQSIDVKEAKWGDVINAVRMVVQELREEYGDDDGEKAAGPGTVNNVNAPSWAIHLQNLPPGEIDGLLRNLLAGNARPLLAPSPAPIVVEAAEQ